MRKQSLGMLVAVFTPIACGTTTPPAGFGCLLADGRVGYAGCPAIDRDADGIPDHLDAAPLEPEDHDGIRDADGVPEREDPPAPWPAPSGADVAATKAPEESSTALASEAEPESATPPTPSATAGAFSDVDGDGIYDAYDLCPEVAEDLDLFADSDGCPEPDNDEDGIADANDICPVDFGEICERGELVDVGGRIFFNPGSEQLIEDESAHALEAILGFIPTLAAGVLVEIHGHTDDSGSAAANLALSVARARAVKAYLVSHGVDTRRLVARGLGPRVPVASNATEEGRAQNRRVEFRLRQR